MALLALVSCYRIDNELRARRQLKNPLKLFNKCISDHECKPDQFCDHTGINPIGSCADGKKLNDSCFFDRHCKSKNCHLLKCVNRKPVKDGPCTKDIHSECLPEQYCSNRDSKIYKCRDRKCSGVCSKDAHCISNKCSLLLCKKPDNGCNSTITTTPKSTIKKQNLSFL